MGSAQNKIIMKATKEVNGLPAIEIPLNENQIRTILRALNNPEVVLHPEYGERAVEVRAYINNQVKLKEYGTYNTEK